MRLGQVLRLRRHISSFKPLISQTCLYDSRRSFFGFPGSSSHAHDEQTYRERKILPYTPKQLYDVVSNVDNYHYFVPYCAESKVLSSTSSIDKTGQEVELKKAQLAVGFLSFKESYVSDVTCIPYSSVEAVASSGTPLFKKLVTTWRMQPAHSLQPHPEKEGIIRPPAFDATQTLLSIDLVFAFSNPLYAAASSAFFKQISAMMVEAFEERCLQIYGRGRE